MKHQTRLIAGSWLLVSCLGLPGCNSTAGPEARCGQKRTPEVYMTWSNKWSYGVQGDTADVGWVIDADRVCTISHVKYHVDFIIDGPTAPEVTPDFWALSGPLRVRTLPLTSSATTGGAILYTAEGDFGLKDEWGEGPGMFAIGISLRFPHQGSEAADQEYCSEAMSVPGYLQVQYYDYR